jgi:hypothetical protein
VAGQVGVASQVFAFHDACDHKNAAASQHQDIYGQGEGKPQQAGFDQRRHIR